MEQNAQDVLALVADFMSDKKSWSGKVADLYALVAPVAESAGTYLPDHMPAFGFIIHRRSAVLLEMGVKATKGRAKGSGVRTIELKKVKVKMPTKKKDKPNAQLNLTDRRAALVVELVRGFMADKPDWLGKTRDLYDVFTPGNKTNPIWPDAANPLGIALSAASPMLAKENIHFQRKGSMIGFVNQNLPQKVGTVPAEAADASPVFDDLALRRERAESKKWKRSYDDALKRIEEMSVQQEVIDSLPAVQAPIPIVPTKGDGADEAVAVFLTSDWHCEEQVDPKTIENRNEYNPEIASRRLKKMWKSALKVVEKERRLSTINEMIIGVLGDLITGYIHDELLESNFLSPTQAIELAQDELVAGLTFMADNGKFKKIHVPCCVGNHGRTTQKRRVSTGNYNSYEWYMYRQVAKYFESDDRFDFSVADGYHLSQDVLGTNLRYHHGEHVRYGGGVGGLTIPFNKAVQAWNKNNPKPADFDCMGHYHSLHFLPDGIINGSVIGWNAFANSIKARYEEPQQALFLVAKDHGPTCFNRIWCD
jgi:hypothetical protein